MCERIAGEGRGRGHPPSPTLMLIRRHTGHCQATLQSPPRGVAYSLYADVLDAQNDSFANSDLSWADFFGGLVEDQNSPRPSPRRNGAHTAFPERSLHTFAIPAKPFVGCSLSKGTN